MHTTLTHPQTAEGIGCQKRHELFFPFDGALRLIYNFLNSILCLAGGLIDLTLAAKFIVVGQCASSFLDAPFA